MKKLSLLFSLSLICCSLLGCPRGETISLDESLNIAKDRYSKAVLASKDKVPGEVPSSLETIRTSLDKFSSASSADDFKNESKAIADTLKPLVVRSGYTSRVALEEILKRYVTVSEGTSGSFNTASAKLLAQRTYHVLSAELENTRFSL